MSAITLSWVVVCLLLLLPQTCTGQAFPKILNATPAGSQVNLRWSPTVPTPSQYYIYAQSYTFSETLAGGTMDSRWVWDGPLCVSQPNTKCGYSSNANAITIFVNSPCDSATVDVRGGMPALQRPEVLDGRTDWRAEVFLDNAVGNNGVLADNTAAGLLIFDVETNLPLWAGQIVSYNGRTFRECKAYGGGGRSLTPTAPDGRGYIRIDYKWKLQRIEVYGKNENDTDWGTPSYFTLASDLIMGSGRYLSSMRIGIHARSWRTSGVYYFTFSRFSLTINDPDAFNVVAAAPGTATTQNVSIPYFMPYGFSIASVFFNGTVGVKTPYAAGVTAYPAVAPFPFNASVPSSRWRIHLDISRERGGSPMSYMRDLSGFRNYAAQANAARRPTLTSNYLGPHTAWKASADSFFDLSASSPWFADTNIGDTQTTFFIVARGNPAAGATSTFYAKNGYDDTNIGFGMWFYGSPPSLNFKVRAKAGTPWGVNVGGITRTAPIQTSSTTVWTLGTINDGGCHSRRLLGFENNQTSLNRQFWFRTNPTPWIESSLNTDADGLYRVGIEQAPCNYSALCQVNCTYSWQNSNNVVPVRIGADSNIMGSGNLFSGEIYEIIYFNNLLPDTSLTLMRDYLMAKYYITCPLALHASANVSTNYGTCVKGYGGMTCTSSCTDVNATLISGGFTRTCSAGAWGPSSPPICSKQCPALVPPPNTACTHLKHMDTFLPSTGIYKGMELYTYASYPTMPSDYLFGTLLRLQSTGGLLVDTTSRWSLPTAVAPLLLYVPSDHIWLTQTQQSSVITVTTDLTITSGTAGLAFRLVVASGGTSSSSYRVVINPSTTASASSHVLQMVTGSSGAPTVTILASAAAYVPLGVPFRLSAIYTGGSILSYVNGVLLHNVTDASPLPHGTAALLLNGAITVSSFSIGVPCDGGDTAVGVYGGMGVQYTCLPGYKQVGGNTYACNYTGGYNGSDPSCSAIPPVFNASMVSVPENSASDTLVGGPLNASSPLDMLYSIIGGDGMGIFKVDACGGQLRVARAVLDYETKASYRLLVVATLASEPTVSTAANITVVILNVNEAPIMTTKTVSIMENATAGTQLTPDMVCTDTEGDACSFIFSNPSAFPFLRIEKLSPSQSRLVLNASDALDYERQPSYTVPIIVCDALNPAVSTSTSLTIAVINSPDAPIIVQGQVISILETFAAAASTSSPATGSLPVVVWDPDIGDTTALTLMGVYGGLMSDGTDPSIPFAGQWAVNATTGVVSMLYAVVASDPANELTINDTFIVRAAFRLLLKATDSTARSSYANVTVIIPVNGAGDNAPYVTSVQFVGTADTSGGDTVTIYGDNFDDLYTRAAAISLVYGPYTTSACTAYAADGTTSGEPARVKCTSRPGIGSRLAISLWIDGVRCRMASPFTFSYGAPVVSAVAGFAPDASFTNTSTDPLNLATQGSQLVYIIGSRFGTWPSNMSVWYGPPFTPTLFACLVLNGQDNYIKVSTAAGAGSGFMITVQIGNQQYSTSTDIGIAYSKPSISSVSGASNSVSASSLSTLGAQQIVIRGANFGPYMLNGTTLLPTVTYGFSAAAGKKVYLAVDCFKTSDSVNTHMLLTCTTVPGVGRALVVSVSIAGLTSDPVYSPGSLLSYEPPLISQVSGPGAAQADTYGGQQIVILGKAFGPPSDAGVSTIIDASDPSYGRESGGVIYGPYTASACVVVSDARIECLSSPGTGAGHIWTVTIAGLSSGGWTGAGSTRMSYAPPTIYSFAGAGAANANTGGGQTVVINGKNIGAAWNASVSAATYVWTGTPANTRDGSLPPYANMTFSAVACYVSVPHIQVTCTTAEAAGMALTWSLKVDGQASSVPVTNYGVPVITRVGSSTGSPLLNVRLGDWIYLTGINFGRPGNASSWLDFITFGQTASEYTATAMEVTSHTSLRFRADAGYGSGISVIVSVGGQVSAASDIKFSFAPPKVTSVLPREWNTDPGSQILTITGTGFALDDPSAGLSVLVGNSADSTITHALTPLTGTVSQSGTYTITLPLQPGIGPNRAVRIMLYRRSAPSDSRYFSYSDPIADTPGMTLLSTDVPVASIDNVTGAGSFFSYRPPRLDYVVVSVPRSQSEVSFVQTQLGCTDNVTFCNYRIIQLNGANFGAGPSQTSDNVARQLEFSDFETGQLSQVSTWPWMTWTHNLIVAASSFPKSRVRVRITSKSFTGYDQVSLSGSLPFQVLSPAVSSLQGTHTNIPTSGGTVTDLLLVRASNLDKTKPVRVLVGSEDCVLYDGVGLTVLTPSQAAFTLVQADGTATIPCLVPAGQGSFNPVVVLRLDSGEWKTSGVSDDIFVSYARPVITYAGAQLGADASSNVYDMRTYSFMMSVTAPTDGSRKIRLDGNNFGLCPVIRINGAADINFCSDASRGITAAPASTRSHTQLTFLAPPGEGSLLSLVLIVADADTSLQPLVLTYLPPSVTGCAAAVPDIGLPTQGVARVICTGVNFGSPMPYRQPSNTTMAARRVTTDFPIDYNDQYPPTISIRSLAVGAGETGWRACVNVIRSQTTLSCVIPEGEGTDLDMLISVGGAGATLVTGVFSYDVPVVSSITCSHCLSGWFMDASPTPTATGIRRGTYGTVTVVQPEPLLVQPPTDTTTTPVTVTLTGSNFGLAQGSTSGKGCVFLAWAALPPGSMTPVCDGLETVYGEGELPSSSITSKSHTSITFRVPPGIGSKYVFVSIAGSTASPPSNASSAYIPQLVYAPPEIYYVSPPSGAVDGGSQITIKGKNFYVSSLDTSASPVAFPAQGMSISAAAYLPTALLRINMHRGCVGDGRALDGSVPAALASCRMTVLSRTHDEIVLLSAPGIGRNRTLNISILEGTPVTLVQTSWPPFPWHFDPPTIDFPVPQLVVSRGNTDASLDVAVAGKNFGRLEDAVRDAWTLQEQEIDLSVAGAQCTTPPSRGTRGSIQIVQCTIEYQTAGPKNISLTIAGQSVFMDAEDPNALTIACDAGFTGGIGQECIVCPTGAVCQGYNRFAPVLAARFADPIPTAGFYNLNQTVGGGGRASCPASVDVVGRPWCIVPCEPSSSCLGDNWCSEGYESKPPTYRCASCASGYFRRASECVKCPNSPVALAIGFVLLVLSIAGAGFLLNRKQINVAFATIAVDFCQVVSIFLNAKVPFPAAVKELLYILSAFNLNIEIVAPECIVPDVSFKLKFGVIVLLPLGVLLFIAGSAGVVTAFKLLYLRQSKRAALSHTHAAISSSAIIMYFFYLYLTRTSLDALNCVPTTPPTYDADGNLITYMSVVFEPCFQPGGTHLAIMPWAILTLCFYSFGYPLGLAVILYRNRFLIMADQLLRAKGCNEMKIQTAEAQAVRKRWHRSYYIFKPDAIMWGLAVLLRKFCIAVTAIIFNRNSAFQLAACLLVMFLAYTAQVRMVPYMSPSEYDEVLKAHETAALTSRLHGRLRAELAMVETRGRKRTRKNWVTMDGKLVRGALLGVFGAWLYNYNTAESSLLFGTVLILLMALMYLASVDGAVYYSQARDSITAVVITVIIVCLLYILVLMIVEVWAGCLEAGAAKAPNTRAARPSSTSSGFNKQASTHNTSGSTDLVIGAVENSVNPMHLTRIHSDGSTKSSNAHGITYSERADASLVASLLSQRSAPTMELWTVFKEQFVEQQRHVTDLQAELMDARKVIETGRVGGGEEGGEGRGGERKGRKSRMEFSPQTSASPIAQTYAPSGGNPLTRMGTGSTRSVSGAALLGKGRHKASSPSV